MVLADIKPNAYYDDESVCQLLHLSPRKLARQRNSGDLQSVTRAGRNYYRGAWLIAWLEGVPTIPGEAERAGA